MTTTVIAKFDRIESHRDLEITGMLQLHNTTTSVQRNNERSSVLHAFIE